MAVFGVPDDYYGEEVMAWIQLKAGQSATEEEMRDWCRGRIAHYKVPRYVWFVDAFPMTVTGKLQKFRMREIAPKDYDLLLIPGGKAPETLRRDEHALKIARAFFKADKPVAAICHGPQVLVSARLLEGRRATCYPAVAQELKDAGALYEDSPVVVDGKLITSRNPGDLPVFVSEVMRQVAG